MPAERRTASRRVARALRDALTLRHLHATGVDCTSGEEARSPWRRWFHHCTFYGFLLCFASTSVAAIYHSVVRLARAVRLHEPAGACSAPLGGVGLLVGPAGLLALRRRRDPALGAPAQQRTGRVVHRAAVPDEPDRPCCCSCCAISAVMAALLVVHLGAVLALFVTLPYGKFVHGIYRTAALVKFARES